MEAPRPEGTPTFVVCTAPCSQYSFFVLTCEDLVHVTNPQHLFQVHPTLNPVLMYANIHVLLNWLSLPVNIDDYQGKSSYGV